MVRQTLERDIDMLEKLAVTEKKAIANEYHLTLRGLDSWLHRIRERRREFQWYINKILAIERRNPRLRKILLSAKMEKEEEEEEEEFG